MNTTGFPFMFLAYVLQIGVILGVGILVPRLVRLKGEPRIALRYWQALVVLAFLLPLVLQWGAQIWPEKAGVANSVSATTVVAFVSSSLPVSGQAFSWLVVLALVGGVGVARLVWIAVGLLTLRRYRREAKQLRPLPATIEDLKRRLCPRAELLVSRGIATPVAFGWRQPTVLVPESFRTMPPAQQQGIACHELLHLRRHDWPMVLAEHMVRVLFWFHPAFRLVLDRIHLSREQLVDSEVVCITGQRRAYLEALWNMAKSHTRASPIAALPFLNENHLLRRVRLLSKEKKMSRLHLMCAITVLFSAVVVAAVAGEQLLPLQASSPRLSESPEPVASPVPSPRPVPALEGQKEKEDIVMPKIKNKVNPAYPDEAKEAGKSGTVKCEAVVSKTGRILNVKVVETSDEVFNQTTIDAIKKWEYHPATKDGQPVKVEMEITVNYVLR